MINILSSMLINYEIKKVIFIMLLYYGFCMATSLRDIVESNNNLK